jgi:hypothetical protein
LLLPDGFGQPLWQQHFFAAISFARSIPSFCAGTIICGKQYNITHDDMPYTFFAIIILLQQKKAEQCMAAYTTVVSSIQPTVHYPALLLQYLL